MHRLGVSLGSFDHQAAELTLLLLQAWAPVLSLRCRLRKSKQLAPDWGSPSKLGGSKATPPQHAARNSMRLIIMYRLPVKPPS